ncbi:MAG: PQQ-dependent sugar dehydrogenase, partial [Planctomycetes bacterium]|nr:PQQ-dependent sugar dehydrogenase [Planctomycetota bacterium]
LSTLLATIIRIDVDRQDPDRNYAIPKDNPFVNRPEARGEIWAYGLRNPWKMSFDRKSGDLWVGDVGWELWELIYRVRKGENYGWSLMEGQQAVHTERERGPTPIVPPTVEIPHTDGASVTGGFVYRGKKFPELVGTYIFGDWETRWIWGVTVDGDKIGKRRDIVQPTVRIVGFAEDNSGELLLLDYDDGTILELERIDQSNENHKFPRRLSETGLFESVADHQVAPGVIPFSINASQWTDHATAERFIAIPGTESIKVHEKPHKVTGSMFNRAMDFPANSVLMKTFSLEMERGRPQSRRRLETQLLHFDGQFWRGYSYEWNDEQTDAVLVGRAGKTSTFNVKDRRAPGGKRSQPWRFPSRTDCIRCHNPWAEHTLAFNLPQINKDHNYGGASDNQIRAFRHIGLLVDVIKQADPDNPFADPNKRKDPAQLPRLADPFDDVGDDPLDNRGLLDKRARSYLHVNCAHCHRFNGGGASYINLQFDLPIGKTGALGVRPTQGTFGIHDAEILAQGDPYRSALYFRMAKLGSGRMPHIGSKMVDQPGLKLIHEWIRQLPVRVDDVVLIDQLIGLDEPAILDRERKGRQRTEWRIAKRIATAAGRDKPNDDDRAKAKQQADQEAANRAAQRKKDRQKLIDDLLSTTSRSMQLARALRQERLPKSIQPLTIAAAARSSQAQVRDLFEPFLPDNQRSRRLGDVVQPKEILSLEGDALRGKQLFTVTAGVQCKNCHSIGGLGVSIGPELSQIGKKYNRAELLESILEPSKRIDPKYVTYLVETVEGRVLTGLLVKKDARELVLKDAQDKLIRIPSEKIEQLVSQRRSLMPELLLRDMTAQQVADLLAYLSSLK